MVDKLKTDVVLADNVIRHIGHSGYPMERGRQIVLVTGHRRENFSGGVKMLI